MRNYIKPMEFAEKFNLSQSMVNDWIHKGKIKAVKLGSGKRSHYRIPLSEVERFENSLRQGDEMIQSSVDLDVLEMPMLVPSAYSSKSMDSDDLVRGIMMEYSPSSTATTSATVSYVNTGKKLSPTSTKTLWRSSTTTTTQPPPSQRFVGGAFHVACEPRLEEAFITQPLLDSYGAGNWASDWHPMGPQGATGSTGYVGSAGPLGPTGIVGPTGPAGGPATRCTRGTSVEPFDYEHDFFDIVSITPFVVTRIY